MMLSNLTFGSGFFVVKAAEMIKEGKTIEEVFKALEWNKRKICSYVYCRYFRIP